MPLRKLSATFLVTLSLPISIGFSVKEDVYREIQEHFMDLVNDPNVDGVFERQVHISSAL
jgi:hypothetical protein